MNYLRKTKHIAIMSTLTLLMAGTALATPQDDADAFLKDKNWAEATRAFEGLLETDTENAANYFNLGRARHHMEDYAGARTAYEKSIEHNFQRLQTARYHLARALVSLNQQEKSLEQLEHIAGSGRFSYHTLQGTSEFETFKENPKFIKVIAILTPCNTPEYRQFSFWLGEWDVKSAGATTSSATNSLTSVHGGCVMMEQYVAGTYSGMSINFYDATTKKWHQTWSDNAGGSLYLEGHLKANGSMVLSDENFETSKITGTINKITWTLNPDKSVQQLWESSTDNGKTWATAFDGIYTKQALDK
ncbi:MAG: hypothetical protein COA69_11495 [Robiginitomaculum sp.]|nr:MAG: hypothetical protein COA69_11495 [Robiginitomaculum sp.]